MCPPRTSLPSLARSWLLRSYSLISPGRSVRARSHRFHPRRTHAEENPPMLKRSTVLLSLAMLVMASCEKSSSSSGSAGGSKPVDPKSVKMVYIAKNTGNPYFDPMIEGFKAASADAGCEFSDIAPADATASSQLPLIKAQIQRGVNVIALSPNSPDALNQVFKEAMGKGITVICVDSDLTGNEQYRTAGVLPTDPEGVGRAQVQLLGELMGYKGKWAIL